MNTLSTSKVNNSLGSVNRYYFKIDNNDLLNENLQKNTVIKYTRIPDFHTVPQDPPRLRRITSVDEPEIRTNRSMRPGYLASSRNMIGTSNRKIINITEDESEYYSRHGTKRSSGSIITKNALSADRPKSRRPMSKLSESTKYSYNSTSAKSLIANKVQVNETNKVNTSKYLGNSYYQSDKKKKINQDTKTTFKSNLKLNVEKISENEKKYAYLRKKSKSDYIKNINQKVENSSKIAVNAVKNDFKEKSNQLPFIKVQVEKEHEKKSVKTVNNETEIDRNLISEDVLIETDPMPEKVNQSTETEYEIDLISTKEKSLSYDCLEVPNVTLTKEKNAVPKEQRIEIFKNSLPNLKMPSVTVLSCQEDERNTNNSLFYKSPSYIIGRATVTYTTRQKINFHVMSSNDDSSPNFRSSPLVYPYSVVSVIKQELCSQNPSEVSDTEYIKVEEKPECHESNVKSFYDPFLNSNKLVKPSDIISTINVNNSMLQNDFICEQFQRELNFIDSFFESLQYLENCFLTEKCLDNCDSEIWSNNAKFKQNNLGYNNILSKLDVNTKVTGEETMASKSLYLLNLLIRDEQRRARNLLLVLKMREDALKDFTKSQIIWLENKKKQENTDISTLKKKQRGALLKLQHECGEMQRMRKALLTLSEKRKAALMKTKKNIELKLNNKVDVEQILLEKKKNKRPVTDRHIAPVKCFDLSSSGCDDSNIVKPEKIVSGKELCIDTSKETVDYKSTRSVEKSIQTGDSILGSIDELIDAGEKNVVVDGGYLNILFQNHTLPQMFSSGKQYEVNEEALRNIVNTSNQNNIKWSDSEVFDKFVEQIKKQDTERSSSPSTARSLVDEFDQYYKDLAEEDNYLVTSPERNIGNGDFETKDSMLQTLEYSGEENSENCVVMTNVACATSVVEDDEKCDCNNAVRCYEAGSEVEESQTGPLPIPVGASQVTEVDDSSSWMPIKLNQSENNSNMYLADSNESISPPTPGISSVTSPVHEAEELRRQQLAIEREIKALEQQQCQLLVVREIPDKPPPPYTPKAEIKPTKSPRLFLVDDKSKEKIKRHITGEDITTDQLDAFDVFLNDYCSEVLQRQKLEISDKPWDSCNLQPQKQELSPEKLVNKACTDLKEIIAGVSPTNVAGAGRERRSDHIDDILFAEWRRCEPEWTALHSDEATVKNQIFENIFQRILTETIVEYKKTIHKKPLNR